MPNCLWVVLNVYIEIFRELDDHSIHGHFYSSAQAFNISLDRTYCHLYRIHQLPDIELI